MKFSLRQTAFVGRARRAAAGGGSTPGSLPAEDDYDSYSVNAALNGLAGGTNWGSAAYIARNGIRGVGYDDFSSYSVDADLNGLNGGTSFSASGNWAGSYVSR